MKYRAGDVVSVNKIFFVHGDGYSVVEADKSPDNATLWVMVTSDHLAGVDVPIPKKGNLYNVAYFKHDCNGMGYKSGWIREEDILSNQTLEHGEEATALASDIRDKFIAASDLNMRLEMLGQGEVK